MERNNSYKLEAKKTFAVKVNQLYKAWTDPEQLKQWWKPMGNQLKEVRNDLQKGGEVTYVFEDDILNISGKYEEVKENEKLVYTWNWEFPNDAVKNGEYKLTVIFEGNGEQSSLHVTQENFQNEEAMQPHKEGWDKGLNDLESFVSGSNNSSQQGESGKNTESAGYREVPEQQKVAGG